MDQEPWRQGRAHARLQSEALTRQLHQSLERLQTNYADIYFMHRDDPDIPIGQFVDVLHEHVKAGSHPRFRRLELDLRADTAWHKKTPLPLFAWSSQARALWPRRARRGPA